MIVIGKFFGCDFSQNGYIKAGFVDDNNNSLYVMSHIKRIYDLVSPFEYYIEDITFLLRLKEIEKSSLHPTDLDIQRWYITDAFTFE